MNRTKKKKHKSSSLRRWKREEFKRELKFCGLIAIICLVVAFGLVVITGRVPTFMERTVHRQIERVVSDKKKEIEREMVNKAKGGDVEKIMKKYMDKVKKNR